MAYQESATLATPDVIINHLVSFAEAAGWFVERNMALPGATRRATVRKPGVTDYIHIYNTDQQNIRMRVSTGYDGLTPPDQQPGVSGENRTFLGSGAYPKTFFFASQDMVWVTVAIAASGEYRHFTFGRLEKSGEYDGGTYIDGMAWPNASTPRYAAWETNTWPFSGVYTWPSTVSRNPGWLRADVPEDGKENYFFRLEGPAPAGNGFETHHFAFGEAGSTGRAARLSEFADDNAFSGRSILHAIPIFVGRTGTELYYSPAGVVQDVRVCSLQKFEPEQEITVGTDVWKVFPIAAKRPMNSATGVQPAASGNYGYAIKKVV